MYNAIGHTYIAIIGEFDDDPVSYLKAMASSEATIWQKAMDIVIHTMYLNGVWTLIDPPKGVKLIGNKWV